jgi:hypothetical protein
VIPRNATLHAAWLPIDRIVVRHADHDLPMNIERITMYRNLLRDEAQSTDPIVVVPAGDVYRVTNGRHRFMAHMVAGRDVIAAVIVKCPQNEDG